MQPVDFQVWGPLAARQKLNCPFANFARAITRT
jgi:hypothetical protein